jgi:hypothetical protein
MLDSFINCCNIKCEERKKCMRYMYVMQEPFFLDFYKIKGECYFYLKIPKNINISVIN